MKRRTFDLHNGAVNRVPDIVRVTPPLVPPNNKDALETFDVHLTNTFVMRCISQMVLILGVRNIDRTSTPNAR